jgi:hypothetical protein
MLSRFPGMDPYLEAPDLWPLFQRAFVQCLHQILIPGLVDRYEAVTAQRRYGEEHEDYIEIFERSDRRQVTLVEVVSPANKLTAEGREAYMNNRRVHKAAGASLVEIDVVLQGKPTLEYSRDGLPEWDYAVTVTRSTQPERYEIYTATLQKRLPRFRLPLASDDRDTVLDLQAVFSRCYDASGLAWRIDYTREPAVPLSEAKRRIVCGLVGLPFFSRDEIAVAAYHIWQSEGCPHGRERDHWQRATEQLQAGKQASP